MAELTDGTAELRVLVTTALGALPLENAIVSVSTVPDESGMRTLLHSVTTDSGGIGCELNDLPALGFVHGEEFLEQFFRAVDEAADGGIQIIPDLLAEQQRRVLEVLQPALRGGVALVGFFGQCGVLFPCIRRHVLCS